MSTTRPSWDDTWLATASDVALRSLCVRDQVGAVIVDSRNRVVDTGYNGPPAGFRHDDLRCDRWCERATPSFDWQGTSPDCVPVDVQRDANGALVDADTGEIIDDLYLFFTSRGYVKVESVSPCYDDCPSLHAEANALSVGDRSQREGGTIYVTSAICYGCAKLIANSGLKRVVVIDNDKLVEHRNSDRSYELLRRCGLIVDILTV